MTEEKKCPLYKKCGGCQLQNLSYAEQLKFKQRKAEKLLGEFAHVEPIIGMAQDGEKADIVFMDPPRAGSDECFLSSLVTLAPKKIVYISCNPETQQRDLRFLTKRGYKVEKIQLVDMFPHTNHVETVVLITRPE